MTNDSITEDLLQRLQTGDAAAEERFYADYAPRLLRVAKKNLSKKLAARLDADDVVQSVFRTFFRRHTEGDLRIQNSDHLWRLLAKITVLKAWAKIRGERAQSRDIDREATAGNQEDFDQIVLKSPGPAEAATLTDLIDQLFQGLHPAHAKVVEMRLGGSKAGDIAAELNVSRQTVYRALERAKERLELLILPDHGEL